MIYPANSKGPYKVPGFHDPNDLRIFGLIFRPDTWTANTVYYKHDTDDYSIVIPTVFTGVYYKAIAPGKSGATEPTWVYGEGEETTDGSTGLIWEAVAYNLMLPSETISSVTYICTNSVTVSSTSNTTTSCQFKIDALPAAAISAGSFQVTVRCVKSNTEQFDTTLEFKVKDR